MHDVGKKLLHLVFCLYSSLFFVGHLLYYLLACGVSNHSTEERVVLRYIYLPASVFLFFFFFVGLVWGLVAC